MTTEVKKLLSVLIANTLVVLLYLIRNIVKKREKMSYLINAVMMFLCPVLGPFLLLVSQGFWRMLSLQQVDLEDVIFSKERVKTYLPADEETEKDMVPLEEAIAVSDKDSLRNLMLSVVKGDTRKSLAAISLAMNSEDTETAHYAASVLQDELNAFRMQVQKMYKEVQSGGKKQGEHAAALIAYMNEVLKQQVFMETEQRAMVTMLENVCRLLHEKDRRRMTPEYYEAICLRLLEIREFDRCEEWCLYGMEKYPEELSSHTCKLKLYFTKGEKQKFFEALEELKRSDVVIDMETLELIRIFS